MQLGKLLKLRDDSGTGLFSDVPGRSRNLGNYSNFFQEMHLLSGEPNFLKHRDELRGRRETKLAEQTSRRGHRNDAGKVIHRRHPALPHFRRVGVVSMSSVSIIRSTSETNWTTIIPLSSGNSRIYIYTFATARSMINPLQRKMLESVLTNLCIELSTLKLPSKVSKIAD